MRQDGFTLLLLLILTLLGLTWGLSEMEQISPPVAATETVTTSLPACVEHDPTAWHPLINEAQGCHYDHEHKENPHSVADIFGEVGALYGGQSISYPWQTFSEMGTENEVKHGGYGWLVRRDMGCFSQFSDGCLTDFRLQFHAVMASMGAVTRYHSFWLEARGCREDAPTVCGLIRTGGWADYGHLVVDGRHVPLSDDPTTLDDGHRRVHYNQTGNANFGTWYGGNRLATVSLQTGRMWGLIDPTDPFALHLFCPDYTCDSNNATMDAHLVGFTIRPEMDTDGDGLVNFVGFSNRHGEIVTGCESIGLDCIPLEIHDMPVGSYQYRDDTHNITPINHDTSPADAAWIRYPN